MQSGSGRPRPRGSLGNTLRETALALDKPKEAMACGVMRDEPGLCGHSGECGFYSKCTRELGKDCVLSLRSFHIAFPFLLMKAPRVELGSGLLECGLLVQPPS